MAPNDGTYPTDHPLTNLLILTGGAADCVIIQN